MTLDTIIREAGFQSCRFPKCSQIKITLYDGKNNLYDKSDIHFAKELFADNPKSAASFFNFISFLEEKPVSSMNIKIDGDYVIVFYRSPQAFPLRRTPPIDPMDYMD